MVNIFRKSEKESPTARNRTNQSKSYKFIFSYLFDLKRLVRFPFPRFANSLIKVASATHPRPLVLNERGTPKYNYLEGAEQLQLPP